MEKEIIQEALGTYLRLSGTGEETVGDRMFLYQNIPGFLPMEVSWINGQKYYVYDISGKVTWEKYFSGRCFDMEDVRYICRQILELPEKLQTYLLDGNATIIHSEYLYLDPRTKELAAVYYPASPYQGIQAVGRLLESMMEQMNPKDQQLAFFVYGMHRLTKEEGTTRQVLKMYLEKGSDKEVQTDVHEQQQKGPGKREKLLERKSVVRTGLNHNVKEKKESYFLPVMFLFAGILLAAALWYSGWFKQPLSGENDWPKGVGATAFFLGVAGYGAWKTWPRRERFTVWEDREENKKVCLIPCQGQEEPIPVSHFPFFLGCERERVDGVLEANDISSIHARILQEGDGVMVMDEESVNGTFHNNERLVPWQKKRIQDGDLLRFARSEYVVEITWPDGAVDS